jgi:LmbE family N-acetylglucosaminyl deacetylase
VAVQAACGPHQVVGESGHVHTPSVLAVFASPGDEARLVGGVLAQHATGGAATAVVIAT